MAKTCAKMPRFRRRLLIKRFIQKDLIQNETHFMSEMQETDWREGPRRTV